MDNLDEEITTTEMAVQLLEDRAFAYKDFDSTDKLSAFQSPPLLRLLGLTHLQDTAGWVDVPGLDLPSKCNYGVTGALALCTAAVCTDFFGYRSTKLTTSQQLERAFQLAATGKLDITQNQDDGEELTISSRYNQRQPRTLNKATGKSSTKGTAFSLQNWGGQTLSYYNAISGRRVDTLGAIVAGALCSLATTDSPISGSSEQSLVDQLELDPRAQMCMLIMSSSPDTSLANKSTELFVSRHSMISLRDGMLSPSG